MLIEALPEWIILNLNVYGLILIGYLVERKFVSRISLFANSIAINTFFLSRRYIFDTYPILQLYADIGLIWGLIGIFKYYEYFHNRNYSGLPKWFYNIGWLWSSIVVGILLLFLQAS
jgi:hypothetical protein